MLRREKEWLFVKKKTLCNDENPAKNSLQVRRGTEGTYAVAPTQRGLHVPKTSKIVPSTDPICTSLFLRQ